MRRHFVIAALAIGALFAGIQGASAQSALLNLPRDSQRAVVTQRIGITDVTIVYHRPQVKGRAIFGAKGVQPYGQVWRAGANENTTINFTSDVTIEGKPLAKGVYGLHMIPAESEWTAMFSKNSTSWGSFTYNQSEDALRVTVKSRPAELQEALVYNFDDVKTNSATLTMRWEKVAVPIHVEVDTNANVMASLQLQLRARAQYEWQSWDEAANYFLDNKLNAEQAAKYADSSIQIEDRFENEMTKARALDTLGRKDDAAAARTKALSMGSQQQVHGYGRQLQQQKKYDEALEVFRGNVKKDPNSWVAHNELSRLAVAKNDYDTAVKEMKLAVSVAGDQIKPGLDALVKRLENKEDINK
jgi:hypothetical protein